MSFKRPLSVSSSPEQTVNQSKNSLKSGICEVCGDEATVINYGALSCQACKTFFRRNGFHPEKVSPCRFNGSCEVNLVTRRSCTACRLVKCQSAGMSSDLIRKEEERNSKYSSTSKSNTTTHAVSKQVTSAQCWLTFNQLPKNRFLNNSEWTLLTNIVRAYDTFSTISHICNIIENLSVLPIEIQCDEANAIQIVTLMYTSMKSFISSSPDFQMLTANEQYSLLAHENMLNDSLPYGTYRFLGSQNVYIELLWKYMVYRYDHYNSVLHFSRLIELFLKLIKYSALAYMNSETYRKLVNYVLKEMKQSIETDYKEQVQLWGKTL